MTAFARTDRSLLGRWWWTVDRWLLAALALLIATGALLMLAASPAVAERIGLDSFYFVRRQGLFLPLSLILLFGFSLAPPRTVRRVAVLMFPLCLAAVMATLVIGPEYNGARRWLSLGGTAVQPSEFLKPCFVVVSAWMFAEHQRSPGFPGNQIAIGLAVLVLGLLAMQPDFGQSVLTGTVWGMQFFLAGLPVIWVVTFVGFGLAGLTVAYLTVPYFASRIDLFLAPGGGDTYQIETALNAFRTGGLFGRGPGEGMVKQVLPDAHADFIFAVMGEEFGLIACLALVALFAFIVLRAMLSLLDERDHFVFLAGAGLVAQFGLQALINLGVNLDLLPAKGMTLPFISYGGSSLLALSIGMGMLLSLTRRPARGFAMARAGRTRWTG